MNEYQIAKDMVEFSIKLGQLQDQISQITNYLNSQQQKEQINDKSDTPRPR